MQNSLQRVELYVPAEDLSPNPKCATLNVMEEAEPQTMGFLASILSIVIVVVSLYFYNKGRNLSYISEAYLYPALLLFLHFRAFGVFRSFVLSPPFIYFVNFSLCFWCRENKYIPPSQRNRDPMSWGPGRQNSPRLVQSSGGPSAPRPGPHDYSPSSGTDQRVVNGGVFPISHKNTDFLCIPLPYHCYV